VEAAREGLVRAQQQLCARYLKEANELIKKAGNVDAKAGQAMIRTQIGLLSSA